MIFLQSGEHIIFKARKHWFVFAFQILAILVLSLAPILILIAANVYLPPNFFDSVYQYISSEELSNFLLFLYVAWLILMWVALFVSWTNYYLDLLIITNQRLIDIEQFVLFRRDEVSIPLRSIQDTKVQVFGLFATLLGFGNLQVQTAGAVRETIIRHLGEPQRVKRLIDEVYQKSLNHL